MSKLFEEIQIGDMVLKNRIVMPPLAVKNPEKGGFVNDIVLKYYTNMSKLGMGLIITENAFPSKESRVMPNQLLLSDDIFIEGHKKLVNEVHKNGVKIAIEINHAGANLFEIPELKNMLKNKDERDFILEDEEDTRKPLKSINEEDLPKEKIREIVLSFGEAARRAKESGYDMIEIHAGHGFLINQFLSPMINKRKDEYGGTFLNRARILFEIIEEVKLKTQGSLISVRLPLSDNPPQYKFFDDGLSLEEGLLIGKEVSYKVNMIDVTGGYSGSRPKEISQFDGYFKDYSKRLKEIVSIPINLTGGIKTPQFANFLIENEYCDTVGIGRALLSNKDWIEEARKELG
ncbi:MAG: NADH:flavin oxidoreductase [Caldisericia bacterium]|jgi:2,4-dienoyl-CoA reductase-like NADH-dependent reductase (Old Yellow Enzyme family)|nr:NADH:flavin oxidoreductase [Caldisericia bacterium]